MDLNLTVSEKFLDSKHDQLLQRPTEMNSFLSIPKSLRHGWKDKNWNSIYSTAENVKIKTVNNKICKWTFTYNVPLSNITHTNWIL